MLYKYLGKRRTILEDGLIRFTQPGAFNDPFELHPSFDLVSKADIAALPLAPGQEGRTGPKAHLMTEEFLQALFAVIGPGLERVLSNKAGVGGMVSLNNNEIARSVFDAKFGVLALTESPDDLLMWTHYADNHRGFVLQLDQNHEFFSAQTFEDQELSLTKVEYSDERPVLSFSNINSPHLYYRKSPAWSYEREWRLIRPLIDATRVLQDHPMFPTHLFRLPFEAITGIIIGVSVPHDERTKVIDLVSSTPRLQHMKVFQVRLSDYEYSLDIHPPIGGYDPDAIHGQICEAL